MSGYVLEIDQIDKANGSSILSKEEFSYSGSDIEREWDADGKVLTYKYIFDTTTHPEGDYQFYWHFGTPGDIYKTRVTAGDFTNPDITSYPYWRTTTMCRVLFKDRENDTIYSQTFVPISCIPFSKSSSQAPKNPKKTNHTFKGWVTEDGSPFDIYNDTITGATTFYADWGHPSEQCHNDTHHWLGCPECPNVKTSAEELHNWDSGTVTKEPTQTEAGIQTYICQTCQYQKTEEIPPKGHVHDFSTEWSFDDDTHWHDCKGCDSRDAENSHDWDSGIVTKKPTETETGIKTYTCQTCGHQKTEVISLLNKPTVSGNDPEISDGNEDGNNPDTSGGNVNGNDHVNDNNGSTDISTGNDTTVDDSVDAGNVGTEYRASNGESKEPKTEDFTHIEVYATIAMIAGLSYLLLYFTDRERGITLEEKNARISQIICWAKEGGFLRRIVALFAIFIFLIYYHSIGKRELFLSKKVWLTASEHKKQK